MIAACPKCGARYRIDDGRLGPQGARLRCARCEAVFRVRSPAASPPPTAPPDEAPLVLVADPDPEAGRVTANALESWGLRSALVHDGVEAILAVQRKLPRVVVLDAALPKMFGFQVCELMKRNESLRHIHVVLVGAIHDRDRYRRPPTETYGADAYAERHELPQALRSLLADAGLELGGAHSKPAEPARSEAQPSGVHEVRAKPSAVQPSPAERRSPRTPSGVHEARPQPKPAPAPRPAAPAARPQLPPASVEGADPAEVEKAQRLARIVVSDIVLYNPEKFESALASGDVLRAMAEELEEGRALFRQRIDAAVREARDFLGEELQRVARERGGK